MRINRYIALATGLSRRAADKAIADGRVKVNDGQPDAGKQIGPSDKVTLDNRPIIRPRRIKPTTIVLNKPVGYVCSRNGQGSKTIYELLPPELYHLKPVGRLDKDSSGLLLLTNDGELAHKLTHPSFQKEKVYEVELDTPLRLEDKAKIESGIKLEDGISKLLIRASAYNLKPNTYIIHMREGRNRQIRRTFAALGYKVASLHRTQFGEYQLAKLSGGTYQTIN